MNLIKYKPLFFCALVAILLDSCKPVEILHHDALKPMPTNFTSKLVDTTNVANINWRDYFNDQNLNQLIDTALQNNLDLQIALKRIEMAQAGVLLREGALRPEVRIGASSSLRKFGLYTMDGAGNFTTEIYNGKLVPIHLPDYFVGLQAQWEIDVWGKLRNQKKAALARYLSTFEGRKLIQTQLVAEIARAYYSLQALDYQLNIIDENIRLQENAVALVQVQKDAGKGNELSIKQFSAQLLNLRGLRQEALQQIVEQENYINFWIGRYPKPIARSSTFSNQVIPALALSGTPSQLLQNRPDIKQAELELVASRADLNAAKAAFYPRIELTGGIGIQAFRLDLLLTKPQSLIYNLLGGLSAPLLNKRAIQAEFNYANAYQQETLLQYQQIIIRAYLEVFNEVANFTNLREVHFLKANEVDILVDGVGTSIDLFRTNRATYLEVLLTQQNALNARLELIDIKKRQLLTSVNIYRALGGGWQ